MVVSARSSKNLLNKYLAEGDVADGHRSQDKARPLVPELMQAFDPDRTAFRPSINGPLTVFASDVILGAAWYTRKYRGARWNALAFILANVVLVIAVPMAVAWLGKYWS